MRTPLEAKRNYRFRFLFLNERFVDGTITTVDGRTARNNYISADAGVLFAGDIGIGGLYLGSNIYFRPVNKDAPLSEAGRSDDDSRSRSVSLFRPSQTRTTGRARICSGINRWCWGPATGSLRPSEAALARSSSGNRTRIR